jgi:hypothetical protein
MAKALESLDDSVFDIGPIETEIPGPTLQIIPIAIFA